MLFPACACAGQNLCDVLCRLLDQLVKDFRKFLQILNGVAKTFNLRYFLPEVKYLVFTDIQISRINSACVEFEVFWGFDLGTQNL